MDMNPKPTVGGVNHLPLSSLRLLVPPLRLMSAFMWQVAQQRDVMQYEKLEEFVTLVTEMVPELLGSRQRTQLILGLRARLVLELCGNESIADLLTLQPHLDRIHTLTEYSCTQKEKADDDELEASDSNFVELVKTLLEDPSEKEHFFQEVFPVHYGPRYDAALQILVWEFVSRLEELLPVPDITQTAAWLGAAPSVLEECGHAVLDPEQLKPLLQHHHQRLGNLKTSPRYHTADTILSTLSLPPKLRIVVDSEEASSDNTRPCLDGDSDQIIEDGTERLRDEEGGEVVVVEEEEDEGHSNEGRKHEEGKEEEEEGQSNDCVTAGLAGGVKPSRVLSCPLCSFTYSRKSRLHQHMKKKHQAHKASRKILPGDLILPRKKIGAKYTTYTCTECGKVYKRPWDLKAHYRTHTLPFRCNQCEKRYASTTLLKIHQRNHTGERPFVCSHCGHGFVSAQLLKSHMRTHTGERPYCCTYCGQTFTRDGILRRHLRMHKGEKNYLCSICGKAFVESGELVLHTRSHTGERPYVCKECGKGFRASCDLTRHTLSHTGERPYSCKECVKCFATTNGLKRHMLVHTGEKPHQCPKCEKRFAIVGNMKTHLKSHRRDEARPMLQEQPCETSCS